MHPVLDAISSDDKSLMGNKLGPSILVFLSIVRGERVDCKYSSQGLADQVNAPSLSDQARSTKQALYLKQLKSILKKPRDRRLAFPSLADLIKS
ncbi:hypothetical protein Nepgr_002841 [Nepenthes gracilis]|uniref:Uncharacterized protein n=1 Tax=Nepenthes gracilis TaxID=150966 RepID=A0AAD3P7U4_NEPGR|nr:hypothetical protein Nepgr_002841 [Nepenthes gracilis]